MTRFQHTAARRRLVSFVKKQLLPIGFNTQPPEGGWGKSLKRQSTRCRFNTQPPEGGWVEAVDVAHCFQTFQHTAARRRLEPLSKALLHQVSQPRFR